MRQIEIIHSTNLLDLDEKVNRKLKFYENVIDVKFSATIFGYYVMIIMEME